VAAKKSPTRKDYARPPANAHPYFNLVPHMRAVARHALAIAKRRRQGTAQILSEEQQSALHRTEQKIRASLDRAVRRAERSGRDSGDSLKEHRQRVEAEINQLHEHVVAIRDRALEAAWLDAQDTDALKTARQLLKEAGTLQRWFDALPTVCAVAERQLKVVVRPDTQTLLQAIHAVREAATPGAVYVLTFFAHAVPKARYRRAKAGTPGQAGAGKQAIRELMAIGVQKLDAVDLVTLWGLSPQRARDLSEI
jgi:hypothetical protein